MPCSAILLSEAAFSKARPDPGGYFWILLIYDIGSFFSHLSPPVLYSSVAFPFVPRRRKLSAIPQNALYPAPDRPFIELLPLYVPQNGKYDRGIPDDGFSFNNFVFSRTLNLPRQQFRRSYLIKTVRIVYPTLTDLFNGSFHPKASIRLRIGIFGLDLCAPGSLSLHIHVFIFLNFCAIK